MGTDIAAECEDCSQIDLKNLYVDVVEPLKKEGQSVTHPPRSTPGLEIDDWDTSFEHQHNSTGYRSYSHHVRWKGQEPPRFLLKRDWPRRCRLSDLASQWQFWSP